MPKQQHDLSVIKRKKQMQKKEVDEDNKKSQTGKWANWCRTLNHPATCECVYN